ncbi:hypothetical protein [Mycobacterium phage CELFI]|uniref:Uncharacterized protein n=1 Tax=Mycobacterium phage CELFI TaxID=2769359 RepID=A0A7G9V4C0_9CAUD|nr:hypothetical protein J4T95_gp098 [Mycobacterium phage CELFI]QNO01126.1 hypothetical protein [Mycobacterium phage CELFI]
MWSVRQSNWTEHMRSLLGEQVVVVLNREPLATAVGELLSFEDGGEVVIRDDMGFVHYCWPALEARGTSWSSKLGAARRAMTGAILAACVGSRRVLMSDLTLRHRLTRFRRG